VAAPGHSKTRFDCQAFSLSYQLRSRSKHS
jgi:hypothetical protein